MLEAVNSVVSNAPLLKGTSDNTRIDKGVSTAPDTVQSITAAPYISPYVYVTKGEAILQIRDNNTGDVQRQIPQELVARRSAPAPTEAEITSSVSAAALTSTPAQAAPTPQPVQVEAPVSTQSAAVEYAAVSEAVTNVAPSAGNEVSIST